MSPVRVRMNGGPQTLPRARAKRHGMAQRGTPRTSAKRVLMCVDSTAADWHAMQTGERDGGNQSTVHSREGTAEESLDGRYQTDVYAQFLIKTLL